MVCGSKTVKSGPPVLFKFVGNEDLKGASADEQEEKAVSPNGPAVSERVADRSRSSATAEAPSPVLPTMVPSKRAK